MVFSTQDSKMAASVTAYVIDCGVCETSLDGVWSCLNKLVFRGRGVGIDDSIFALPVLRRPGANVRGKDLRIDIFAFFPEASERRYMSDSLSINWFL